MSELYFQANAADRIPMPVTELVTSSPVRSKSLDDYAREYLAGFLNLNTRKSYAADLRHFLGETKGNLSDESLLVYREILIKNSSPRTASRRLVAISGLLDSLVFNGVLTKNIYGSIKNLCPRVDKFDSPGVALSDDEVRVMLDHAGTGTTLRMVLVLSFFLGLRVSEIVSVGIQDITSGKLKIRGKGNKVRTLELDEYLLREIQDHLVKSGRSDVTEGYLVATRESLGGLRKVGVGTVNRWISECAQECGIEKKVSSHTGRRTMITKLLEEGTPIRDVSSLAGHTSIETTQIYDKKRREVSAKVISRVRY